jgi:hypothetical protein
LAEARGDASRQGLGIESSECAWYHVKVWNCSGEGVFPGVTIRGKGDLISTKGFDSMDATPYSVLFIFGTPFLDRILALTLKRDNPTLHDRGSIGIVFSAPSFVLHVKTQKRISCSDLCNATIKYEGGLAKGDHGDHADQQCA